MLPLTAEARLALVPSVPEAQDRLPPFLSRRIKRLLTEHIIKLSAWAGHKYNSVEPVPLGKNTFTGWKGQAVFAFQNAKNRFCASFAEDIATDRDLMMQSFKNGQQEVLESDGLWTDEMAAMDAATFWEEFIPPEPGQPCKRSQLDLFATPCDKRLPFDDTLQGHFLRGWEDNDGDLFSLELAVTFIASNDGENKTGGDEIQIVAGLNGDYVLLATHYIKRWSRTLALADIEYDPTILQKTFDVASAFFESLR